MKQKLFFAFFLALIVFTAPSCKKDHDSGNGLSSKINNIISQEIIDELESRGMAINKGDQPPSIEGIYLANPYTLTSPYSSEDPWQAGHVIGDYKYKMYDQKGDDVKLDYKNASLSDIGNGVASFISGSSKKFSLFAQLTGVSSGISYKQVSIISGEITADGIKDFQFAFVLTEKGGDGSNSILIPVGKPRIWRDDSGIASTTSLYKQIIQALSTGTVAGNKE
ncbi:MAG: hypothetical protein ABI402_09865 [Ferruginibacter sp.]